MANLALISNSTAWEVCEVLFQVPS